MNLATGQPQGINYGSTNSHNDMNTPLLQTSQPGYSGSAGVVTGVMLIIGGVLSVVFGIASSIESGIGYGIWAGLLFYIPTGVLGIISARKHYCVIVTYMVMSILSSCCGAAVIIWQSLAISGDLNWPFYYYAGNAGIDIVLILISFGVMVTAIVAASFCCGGLCRSQAPPSIVQHTTVMNNLAGPANYQTQYGAIGGMPLSSSHAQSPPDYQYAEQPPFNLDVTDNDKA